MTTKQQLVYSRCSGLGGLASQELQSGIYIYTYTVTTIKYTDFKIYEQALHITYLNVVTVYINHIK